MFIGGRRSATFFGGHVGHISGLTFEHVQSRFDDYWTELNYKKEYLDRYIDLSPTSELSRWREYAYDKLASIKHDQSLSDSKKINELKKLDHTYYEHIKPYIFDIPRPGTQPEPEFYIPPIQPEPEVPLPTEPEFGPLPEMDIMPARPAPEPTKEDKTLEDLIKLDLESVNKQLKEIEDAGYNPFSKMFEYKKDFSEPLTEQYGEEYKRLIDKKKRYEKNLRDWRKLHTWQDDPVSTNDDLKDFFKGGGTWHDNLAGVLVSYQNTVADHHPGLARRVQEITSAATNKIMALRANRKLNQAEANKQAQQIVNGAYRAINAIVVGLV